MDGITPVSQKSADYFQKPVRKTTIEVLGQQDVDDAHASESGGEQANEGADEVGDEDVPQERKKLHREIQGMGDIVFDDFRRNYSAKVKGCLVDRHKVDEKTLLHFLVNKGSFEDSPVQVGYLIDLALEQEPGLLKITNDTGSDTALHLAVRRQDHELIRHMCRKPKIASDAIAVQNQNDETCLHLAINESRKAGTNLELVKYLIDIACSETFVKKRSSQSKDDKNTPLHDAVNISLCVAEIPVCEKDFCQQCRNAKTKSEKYRQMLLEIVRGLTDRGSKAMTELNAAGESPYLFHVSSRSKIHAEAASGSAASNPKSAAALRGTAANKKQYRSGDDNANANDMNKIGDNPKSENRSNTVKKRTAASHKCKWEYSEALAMEVEKYLKEKILSEMNFENACKSLFGTKNGM